VEDPLAQTDVFGLSGDCGAAQAKKGLELEAEVEAELKRVGIPYIRGQKFHGPLPIHCGEIDFEVENAVIEVTVKKSDKMFQIEKLLTPHFNPTGKTVILFAQHYGGAASRDVERAGALVVRSMDDLIGMVK
jgi:hypothetical protein